MKQDRWSIVLAGGDGIRLRGITRDARGEHCPKQFCSFGGGPSLLRRAIARSVSLVPRTHIVPVVVEAHRHWWTTELEDLPSGNITVQPKNRGTAPAILLSLLTILEQNDDATVVVVPSDHLVESEEILRRKLDESFELAGDRLVMLGMRPRLAHGDLGWIQALETADSHLMPVGAFVEKPDRLTAARLMSEGALVNTMILVGSGRALFDLYRQAAPMLVRSIAGEPAKVRSVSRSRLQRVYEEISSVDFSKDVLEEGVRGHHLWVNAVPECGWSDLGTRERLESARRYLGWSALLEAADPRGRLGSDYFLG
jgi:mannose-1-phosphate guanylyltransferase